MGRLFYLLLIIGVVILPFIVPQWGAIGAAEKLEGYCATHLTTTGDFQPGTLPACAELVADHDARQIVNKYFHVGTPAAAWVLYGIAIISMILMLMFDATDRLGLALLTAVPCTLCALLSFVVGLQGYDISPYLHA